MTVINKEIKKLHRTVKRSYIIHLLSSGVFGKINLQPIIDRIDSIFKEYPFNKENLNLVEQLKEISSRVQLSFNYHKSTPAENIPVYKYRHHSRMIFELLSKIKSESTNCTIGLFEFEKILKEIKTLRENYRPKFVKLLKSVKILVNIYSKCFQSEKRLGELNLVKITHEKLVSAEDIETLAKFTENAIIKITERERNS